MERKRRAWIQRLLVALLVGSLGLNAWMLTRRSARKAEPQQTTPSKRATIEQLRDAVIRESNAVGRRDLLGSSERDWLRRLGFAAPAESLIADLVRHPELIPAEGVLGGTMHFLPQSIYLLPGQHVWAIAEDGHIAHAILLQYRVHRDTTIHWEVVYHRAA